VSEVILDMSQAP